MTTTNKRRTLKAALAGSLTLVAAIGALFVAARGAASEGFPAGVTAGVSALDNRPAAASLPPRARAQISMLATTTGMAPDKALAGTRVLRSGLGSGAATAYAFKNENGSPCVVLSDRTGFCAKDPADGTPGLHWAIGGGSADEPSNLIAVASDDVARVTLTVDGADIRVTLANNIAFVEFPADARAAAVMVIRHDGSSNAFTVNLTA